MTSPRLVYKLVAREPDGKLTSLLSHSVLSVDYQLGSWIVPRILRSGLYVYSTLKDARKVLRLFNTQPTQPIVIIECEAVGVVSANGNKAKVFRKIGNFQWPKEFMCQKLKPVRIIES